MRQQIVGIKMVEIKTSVGKNDVEMSKYSCSFLPPVAEMNDWIQWAYKSEELLEHTVHKSKVL